MHRILIESMPEVGATLRIEGEEARHAVRVKRLEAGEAVELLDGRGHVARSRVVGSEKSHKGEWALRVEVEGVVVREPAYPRVHVLTPAPKGDRLEDMIDQLSQVGAASWSPLETIRTIREPREHTMERLHRIARESAKQCGRAWAIEIGESRRLVDVLEERGEGVATVMADAGGPHYMPGLIGAGVREVRLLLGPEGDWDPREIAMARERGVATASFGPHVMRIAQAAAAATAIVQHLAHGAG